MKMETMLMNEIENQIEELGKMELGGEQYEKTINGIAKLSDKVIEIEKLSVEHEKHFEEKELQEAKLAEEKRDRKWRNGIAIANIGVLVLGAYGAYRFEEKGTITTQIGRNFIGWFKPKK